MKKKLLKKLKRQKSNLKKKPVKRQLKNKMHSTKTFLLAFILITCLVFPLTASDKTYKATKQGVNIRIDSTSLSESIGVLSSQDKVRVVSEKYNWYRIK